MMHMSGFRLRACFTFWRGIAAELASLQHRMRSLTVRVATAQLRSAWDGWLCVLEYRAWVARCNSTALRKFMLSTGDTADGIPTVAQCPFLLMFT
jgi:hypothetical protein